MCWNGSVTLCTNPEEAHCVECCVVRNEGGGLRKVSFKRVTHYFKVCSSATGGGKRVLGCWVVAVNVFVPNFASEGFKKVGKALTCVSCFCLSDLRGCVWVCVHAFEVKECVCILRPYFYG